MVMAKFSRTKKKHGGPQFYGRVLKIISNCGPQGPQNIRKLETRVPNLIWKWGPGSKSLQGSPFSLDTGACIGKLLPPGPASKFISPLGQKHLLTSPGPVSLYVSLYHLVPWVDNHLVLWVYITQSREFISPGSIYEYIYFCILVYWE